jgi:Family of unknown function (DUF6134)
MPHRLTSTFIATVVAASLSGASAFAQRPESDVATKQFTFAVMRNGSQIGEYNINIKTEGRTQIVDVSTQIKVTVLMLTAYYLLQTGREVWTDGHFVSYKGTTNDNGKQHSASLTAGPSGETLVVDGRRERAPKGALPATFWSAKSLDATTLVDPGNGKIVPVSIEDMGPNPVPVDGAPETARHYHITGLNRDVWMSRGHPVRFQLKGSDNSTIVSELRNSSS